LLADASTLYNGVIAKGQQLKNIVDEQVNSQKHFNTVDHDFSEKG
jgi:hypothetical protein